eukprot:5235635-Pleurochrysis_carterae.AAC.3
MVHAHVHLHTITPWKVIEVRYILYLKLACCDLPSQSPSAECCSDKDMMYDLWAVHAFSANPKSVRQSGKHSRDLDILRVLDNSGRTLPIRHASQRPAFFPQAALPAATTLAASGFVGAGKKRSRSDVEAQVRTHARYDVDLLSIAFCFRSSSLPPTFPSLSFAPAAFRLFPSLLPRFSLL